MVSAEEYNRNTVGSLIAMGWPEKEAQTVVDIAQNAAQKAFDSLNTAVSVSQDPFHSYQSMKLALYLVQFKAGVVLKESCRMDIEAGRDPYQHEFQFERGTQCR